MRRWDYECPHTNGVRWKRFGKKRWGVWIVDRKAPDYDTSDTSSPWSPALLVRLPRFTVAILHPDGR